MMQRTIPLILVILAGGAPAQQQPVAVTSNSPSGVPRSASDASIFTRRDARTITLAIPAPRGLITDRDGAPLAQNRVVFQLALQFPQFEEVDRAFVVNWGRERVAAAGRLVERVWDKTDEELWEHYRHRRWLPLYLATQVGAEQAAELESKLPGGLILQPVYARYYPEEGLAAHLIGYTGSVGKLETGPINYNEPLWEMREGRAGFEKLFDKELQGEPGTKRLLFDSDGRQLLNDQPGRPVPGGTVVSTLDLDWQRVAEKVLRDGCKRGAMVVIDVISGEVLVMASRPSFDLNRFIPGIATEDYRALEEDPGRPLFGRAFQSAYPPGSAFKPVVALAALNNGTITEYSTVYCPAFIQYGNHKLWNWSKSAYGDLPVKSAIKYSNNPWFAQVGNRVGWGEFLGLARRLGFGSRSGLPLIGETEGLVPNDEWMREHHGRRILEGDTANMAIGQGTLLASPLQVAQLMAGIGNGGVLPKLHLVRQVHDRRGRVIMASSPERRNWLGLNPEVVEIVREGMKEVVNDGGTGARAQLSYTELCGKTGTAQWGPESKNQGLAWFAGFLPRETPRYSFAVVYEGSPGEKVSGGRDAGPMVRSFFEQLKSEIEEQIKPPPKAVVIVDPEADAESAEDAEDQDVRIPRALPVDPGEIGVGEDEESGLSDGVIRRGPPPTLGVRPPEPPEPPEPPVSDPEEERAPRALPVDPGIR